MSWTSEGSLTRRATFKTLSCACRKLNISCTNSDKHGELLKLDKPCRCANTTGGKCKQTISLNFLTLDTSKTFATNWAAECLGVFFFSPFLFLHNGCLRRTVCLSKTTTTNCSFSSHLLPRLSLPALLPSPLLTLPFQMSASQRDISHRVARVCVRVQEGEKERLRRITSKISPAFYAQMSSLSLPLSPPLMWPVLISGADIAAVPSPLVEKDSFPTEKDALEHSTRTQHTHAHSHTQTHSSTFEQWEEAALTENGFFWGGEWKDQVAVKSTKPRATLRAARCQQLLFCLSMCCARTRTHKHTATGTQTHNCLWQEQAALWPLAGSWLRQTLTLQITDFHTFSLVFSPKNSWIIPKLNFLLEETMNGFYKTQKNKHISNPACVFMKFFLRIFWNWPEDDKCCSNEAFVYL